MVEFNHNGETEKCTLSKDVFTGLTTAHLLSSKFSNTHGTGRTNKEAVTSLKIRLNQLKNPNVTHYNQITSPYSTGFYVYFLILVR